MDRREFLKVALAAPLVANFTVPGKRSDRPK